MKTLTALLVGLLLTVPVMADTYRLRVRRVDSNIYMTTDRKTIIETRLCLALALGEDAVLNWEGRFGNNWIYFPDSRERCDVVALR